MRINHKHKFVFISTPKAGTHTIYKILQEHFSEGLESEGFHVNTIPYTVQDYYRWTVIRNPYSRAVSLWWSAVRLHPEDFYGFRKRCGSAEDFETFITWLAGTSYKERLQEPLMLNQFEWLCKIQPLQCIYLDSLEEGLKKLPFWSGNIKIPKLNTTESKIQAQEKAEKRKIQCPEYKKMFTSSKAVEAVERWAFEDFNYLGFIKEEFGNE